MPSRRTSPRRAVTGRALVLGTLVVVLVVVLASPVHRYFASRGDVNQAAAQLQYDRQQLAQLKKQQVRWSDPGYIEAQARTRLQYAMPGDIVFVVVRPGQQSTIRQSSAAKSSGSAGSSWNKRLWGSVTKAGAAP